MGLCQGHVVRESAPAPVGLSRWCHRLSASRKGRSADLHSNGGQAPDMGCRDVSHYPTRPAHGQTPSCRWFRLHVFARGAAVASCCCSWLFCPLPLHLAPPLAQIHACGLTRAPAHRHRFGAAASFCQSGCSLLPVLVVCTQATRCPTKAPPLPDMPHRAYACA
jgi:hypothetical protein